MERRKSRLWFLAGGKIQGINQNWMISAVDLEGNPRNLKTIVDMGAYETVLRQGNIMLTP